LLFKDFISTIGTKANPIFFQSWPFKNLPIWNPSLMTSEYVFQLSSEASVLDFALKYPISIGKAAEIENL